MNRNYQFFLNKFIRPYAFTLAFIVILEAMGMIFTFISPLLAKSLIDDVFMSGRTELFGYILLGTIITYVISSISTYLSNYSKGKIDLAIFNDVSKETFYAIQSASIKKTQDMKVGDLLSRIMANTRSAIVIFTQIAPEVIVNIARMIMPIIIMLHYNWRLTLIVIIPASLFLIPMWFFGKKLEKTQKVSLEKNAAVYSFLKENLSMIPLIKVFRLETWSRNKFNHRMNDYYDATIDYTKNNSLNFSVDTLMYGVPMVLLLLFGSPMVIEGSLSIGTFTLFMSNVALAFSPISQFAFLWSYYKSTSPAFDRVSEIFQLEQDVGGEDDLVLKDGIITFDDAWFSYDGRYILQGFNASFKKGLNYVIGDNGVGKTTILKLLCALYPLDKGRIRIDEQEISHIKKTNLRDNISMIFSEPYLFDGSIYENIHIGDLSAHKGDVIHAAKQVRIHEFITSLPNGYETLVGEGGLKLSSGEKQKIALARAILKNSPVILLDEVTKSIDMDSRKSINEVIRNLRYEKTIIIITHNTDEIEEGSNIVYLGQETHRSNQTLISPIFMSKAAFSWRI